MELSQDGYGLTELLLKHYTKEKKEDSETKENIINKQDNSNPDHLSLGKDKYSLDYKKFESLSMLENDENEKQKIEDQFKNNPYLAQMGCSHDRRKEREIFEKPTKEKLESSEFFKKEGNIAYKDKDYEKAAYFYQKALLQFDYTFTETDDEEKMFNELKEACHCNMALTKYQLKDFKESLIHCTQALKINPKNKKALFRKGTIYYDKDQFDDCQKIINAIYEIDDKDQDTNNLKEKLEKKISDYKKKEKVINSKMINGA